jgi:hypothetical protein
MKRLLNAYVIGLLLIRGAATTGFAQTEPPEKMIRQILATHMGPNALPADFVIQAQATDASGPHSLRIEVKGKNQIRLEATQGTNSSISIYNAGEAWTGTTGNLKSLMAFASQRRPMELPFLDLVSDVGDPHWSVRYIGPETLGTEAVLHFTVHFADPVPIEKRLFHRPLHEDAEFFVDAKTNLIVRSQRLQPANDSMDFRVPFVMDFSDYRPVNGMMIPFHIVNTIGNRDVGLRQVTFAIQSVLINQGIPDSAFRPQ